MTERYLAKTANEMAEGEPNCGWNAFGDAEARTREAVAAYNSGRRKPAAFDHDSPPVPASYASLAWFIVDLHSPWHRAHRYVVREAGEMREGEPCINAYGSGCTRVEVDQHCVAYGDGRRKGRFKVSDDFRWSESCPWNARAIIDTHSAAWLAFDRAHRDAGAPAVAHRDVKPSNVSKPAAPPSGPREPTDDEIVNVVTMHAERRERFIAKDTAFGRPPSPLFPLPLVVDGRELAINRSQYQAARSRLLASKLTASERARRLPVQVDCPEDHEAPDAPSVLGDMAAYVRDLFGGER